MSRVLQRHNLLALDLGKVLLATVYHLELLALGADQLQVALRLLDLVEVWWRGWVVERVQKLYMLHEIRHRLECNQLSIDNPLLIFLVSSAHLFLFTFLNLFHFYTHSLLLSFLCKTNLWFFFSLSSCDSLVYHGPRWSFIDVFPLSLMPGVGLYITQMGWLRLLGFGQRSWI